MSTGLKEQIDSQVTKGENVEREITDNLYQILYLQLKMLKILRRAYQVLTELNMQY